MSDAEDGKGLAGKPLVRLIEQLESAAVGSRELDEAVLLACGWTVAREMERGTVMECWKSPEMQGVCRMWEGPLPSPTTSIDAALTLVPEGWFVENLSQMHPECGAHGLHWLCQLVKKRARRDIRVDQRDVYDTHSRSTSPALAACIAALKARRAATQAPQLTAVPDDIPALPASGA